MSINAEKNHFNKSRLIMIVTRQPNHINRGSLGKDFAPYLHFHLNNGFLLIVSDSCSAHFKTNSFEVIKLVGFN